MTTFELKIIKINIITAILTFICISCAPVNTVEPKINDHTNSQGGSENSKNESGDLKPANQEHQKDEKDSKRQNTILKLKEIGKTLENQKKKEKEEQEKIKKLNTEDYNFTNVLDDKALYFLEKANLETKMQIKRILYSSLDYNTDEIKKLKEIFDQIIKTSQGKEKELALTYLLQTAEFIQSQLDEHLKTIKMLLDYLNQKDLEDLIIHIEYGLKLKAEFAKQLKETVTKFNNEAQKKFEKNGDFIWNASEALEHIKENYLKFYSIVSGDVEYKKMELNKQK
ncbi:complement regulator-acquiring protein (plasmid) [Borrelia sp. CA_690]|uniref:complement regulator-acquiring protein n=1 Tax=Borrelia TaxID=138 RepID=UPI00165FC41E|nr:MULTISPECIES: complement regulator-acquiring protein [Borrelia]WKC84008.1 complement regulator-acquiring protein [Borrelia sp. CA_690]